MCWAMRPALAGVLRLAPKALGASLGRPRDPFGRLLAALGTPKVSQDRLGDVNWVSKNRPMRVRVRPRDGLGRPKWPMINFSSIFGRLGSHFRRFSTDFLSIR